LTFDRDDYLRFFRVFQLNYTIIMESDLLPADLTESNEIFGMVLNS
jgi:hypothetical protein